MGSEAAGQSEEHEALASRVAALEAIAAALLRRQLAEEAKPDALIESAFAIAERASAKTASAAVRPRAEAVEIALLRLARLVRRGA